MKAEQHAFMVVVRDNKWRRPCRRDAFITYTQLRCGDPVPQSIARKELVEYIYK